MYIPLGFEDAAADLAATAVGYAKKAEDLLNRLMLPNKDPNNWMSIKTRREIASTINKFCRDTGTILLNPKTKRPCIILVINDGAKGKFILEDCINKMRSCTTLKITELLPFTLQPLWTAPIHPDTPAIWDGSHLSDLTPF
ncbi:hypothetical protein BH10PLA2_BH10PLA2_27420 [soil metagenome]